MLHFSHALDTSGTALFDLTVCQSGNLMPVSDATRYQALLFVRLSVAPGCAMVRQGAAMAAAAPSKPYFILFSKKSGQRKLQLSEPHKYDC
jgi:hypothetical protein